MTNPNHAANASRTVTLAVGAWGVLAAGVAASPALGTPGGLAAIATAVSLGAIAWTAYAADEELREAARNASRARLLRFAYAFDALALALVALAATDAAPLGIAIWKGIAAGAPLFAAPLAAAFHAAALDAPRPLRITLSGPARSPRR